MAGRGRGMVLPAWMTQKKSDAGAPGRGSGPSSHAAAPSPSSAGPGAAASAWSAHTAPDGRTYYYNKVSGRSVWVRPAEMGPEPGAGAPPQRQQQPVLRQPQQQPVLRQPQQQQPVLRQPQQQQPMLRPAQHQPQQPQPAAASVMHRQQSAAQPQPQASLAPENAWKEFKAPDGRPYYYNSVTKKSVWVAPAEFLAAKSGQSPSAASAPAATSAPASVPGSHSGKGKDVGAGSASTSDNNTRNPSNNSGNNNNNNNGGSSGGRSHASEADGKAGGKRRGASGKPRSVVPTRKRPDRTYANRQERIDDFKALLTQRDVTASTSWDDAMPLICDDPRYNAPASNGERRHAFNEYIAHRRKTERIEHQRRLKAARDALTRLLATQDDITPDTRFSAVEAKLRNEPEWQVLGDDHDRRDLFDDHIRLLQRLQRDEQRSEYERALAAFTQLLRNTASITHVTAWSTASELLAGEPAYQALDMPSRAALYQEHIHCLADEHYARQEATREALRAKDRQARDQFRALLAADAEAGVIDAASTWPAYRDRITAHPAYTAMLDTASGSTAAELFQDVVDRLIDELIDLAGRVRDQVPQPLPEQPTAEHLTASSTFADLPAKQQQAVLHELTQQQGFARERRVAACARRLRRKRVPRDTPLADVGAVLGEDDQTLVRAAWDRYVTTTASPRRSERSASSSSAAPQPAGDASAAGKPAAASDPVAKAAVAGGGSRRRAAAEEEEEEGELRSDDEDGDPVGASTDPPARKRQRV